MSDVPALETRALWKRFGGLVVANAIDFRLAPGARHALIGPNGAGKTTFINLITGRLAASSGQILIGGQDVTLLPEAQRVKRGLGRTFQINTLFGGLSVLENLTLAIAERTGIAGQMLRVAGRHRHIAEEAYARLEHLKLAEDALRPVRALSYGRQRLVEIAIALAQRPKVLLLDEPAAGVPREESQELFSAIAGLSQEITVLFIEHDMELVFRFASRVIVLVGGRVLVEGTAQEIATDPLVRAVYLGKTPDRAGRRNLHEPHHA
jgi:branched-chain amino acid transport system ATP-binding protein